MEVILLERVGRLGATGDVVKVKDGFGRNFLIPQKKALRATDENRKVFEGRRAQIESQSAAHKAEAEKQAKKLQNVSLKLVRQASEDGKLYGSIGARDVADALAELGHTIERKRVTLGAAIKNTGTYTAHVTLHPEVVLDMQLTIVRNEADAQEPVVPEELKAVEEEASEEKTEE